MAALSWSIDFFGRLGQKRRKIVRFFSQLWVDYIIYYDSTVHTTWIWHDTIDTNSQSNIMTHG